MPKNWKKDAEPLEMLFFFYQVSEELLNEKTPDSFALPMHNAITLLIEMSYVNELLKKYGLVEKFYSKYIPVIIEEFLEQFQSDIIIKEMLNHRYDSIRAGFEQAKGLPNQLNIWIEAFQQAVSFFEYIDHLKKKIAELIVGSKRKKNLLSLVANFYIMLLAAGYSKEQLRKELSFFEKNEIDRPIQIESFFNLFTFQDNNYDFLIIVDYQFFSFLKKIDNQSYIFNQVQQVDLEKEHDELIQNKKTRFLLEKYNRIRKERKKEEIRVVRWSTAAIDPYIAAKDFVDSVTFLQTLPRYFNHNRYQRTIYFFLLKNESDYEIIKLPSILNTKDSAHPELIESFVKNVIDKKSMSSNTNLTVMHAMEMHSGALEIKKIRPLFQNFWTALETLFLSPNKADIRTSVNKSVVQIMQKIYTLKLYRAVFKDVECSIDKETLGQLGINDFRSFVAYLSSHKDDDVEMKEFYSKLGENSLLRFRVYWLRNACADECSFCNLLKKHQTRIEWHIERLYRMRNIATHVGQETPGMDVAVNHLHNYFDYVVNYILCKSAANNFVCGVASVVHEAKNDEEIHLSLIKEYKNISPENYMTWLFGPDKKMIDYTFDCL